MSSQKQSGKAFEFAVLQALLEIIGPANINFVHNASLKTAQADFTMLPLEKQTENILAVKPAIELLQRFEPNLALAKLGQHEIQVSLQSDQAGGAGDVRDVIIALPGKKWEIGISAKHQHEALKHSRLSRKIDFGSKWFGVPCTSEYFAQINPIFDRLEELKNANLNWSQVVGKERLVYVPILEYFRDEVMRLDLQSPNTVARNLVAYLIGLQDFYKVIKLKGETKVQVFNFFGTLNAPARGLPAATKLERLKLPTRVVEIAFKRDGDKISETTLEMICDAGWQLSFRLHSASSKVESSLKFDINLIGRPNNLQTISLFW